MAAFKEHATFGFWKASLIEDADQLLTLKDKQTMGNLGKLQTMADLPPDDALIRYIKAAMKLNEDGVKIPKKQKAPGVKTIETPEYFAAALADVMCQKPKKISRPSPIHKWLEEAKTETARNKRMAQAVEWIENGKGQNWKYEKC
ncbi:MAG: YdeI/OmpD-associated family protein [Taibaiella sp.]|nr:YdeI/OmpD-associated family protein [Taibaiella sp.]